MILLGRVGRRARILYLGPQCLTSHLSEVPYCNNIIEGKGLAQKVWWWEEVRKCAFVCFPTV